MDFSYEKYSTLFSILCVVNVGLAIPRLLTDLIRASSKRFSDEDLKTIVKSLNLGDELVEDLNDYFKAESDRHIKSFCYCAIGAFVALFLLLSQLGQIPFMAISLATINYLVVSSMLSKKKLGRKKGFRRFYYLVLLILIIRGLFPPLRLDNYLNNIFEGLAINLHYLVLLFWVSSLLYPTIRLLLKTQHITIRLSKHEREPKIKEYYDVGKYARKEAIKGDGSK
ncbi:MULTISPECIES: hypothetical protein [Roseivirga]|uniref:Uncharacterized protein n=1 Tax=Roseivirga spongicola TaxID=333140 RepID=A0A150XFJ4_9BACT|nr:MULTISPECIES: hypothetical protein [Roseivirga]KYG77499.1 hypothetical protein AWW68_01645 [Roseivirga spongicola]MBO6661702.1 hypothetical protein [Roseivirga sp.]MBO6908313.1 hypothetical protein [Roseivirga sp.]WPZ11208.1 hypothetical protein T7867_03720 [Roseivirga spongicola]